MPPPPGYTPPSSFPCFLNIKHSHRKLQRLTLSFCFVMFRLRSRCCSFDFVVKIEVNSIYCDISKVNYKLVH